MCLVEDGSLPFCLIKKGKEFIFIHTFFLIKIMQKLKAERCFCALGLYAGPPFCRAGALLFLYGCHPEFVEGFVCLIIPLLLWRGARRAGWSILLQLLPKSLRTLGPPLRMDVARLRIVLTRLRTSSTRFRMILAPLRTNAAPLRMTFARLRMVLARLRTGIAPLRTTLALLRTATARVRGLLA